MGLNDLLTELEKVEIEAGAGVLGLTQSDERRLVKKVLEMLPDKSTTVQEQAVKAIGPLSNASRDQVSQEIVQELSKHLLFVPDIGSANSTKAAAEELRDIASIGIKNVIATVSAENGALVQRLLPAFLRGLTENADNQDVVGFVVEGLADLLQKFAGTGALSAGDCAKVLKAVQPLLSAKRTLTRKRAIGCLGLLAASVPDALFSELMQHLIELLGSAAKADDLRTYIQAVTAVSRAVGFRLGKYLPNVVPLLIKAVEDESHDEDDDLRESAFSCFETMLLRCQKDVSPFIDDFVRLGLQFVKHDPNYEDEEDEDEEMEAAGDDAEEGDGDEEMDGEDDEEWEYDEEDEDEDYDDELSDDDDMSWKVRRSAAKVLGAVVQTRRERLFSDVFETIAPALVRRFGEREENVRLDVYGTFTFILQQTRASTAEDLTRAEGALEAISGRVVKQLAAQIKLRSASIKGRSGVFSLLRELLSITPTRNAIVADVASLVPGLQLALGEGGKTDATLKIDSLIFLRELLQNSSPDAHVGTLAEVAPLVCGAAGDEYYRISAEGLRTAAGLVPVMAKAAGAADDVLQRFTDVVLAKLEVTDIDQEVKEGAIVCVGELISLLGSHAAVAPRVPATLATLRQRLRNEITRLTAVRCVGTIAGAAEKVELGDVFGRYLSELSGFLRKANRQLKQSSLHSLRMLISNYGASDPDALSKLIGSKEGKHHLLKNISPLIADSDLQLSHLSLAVCAAVAQTGASGSAAVAGHAQVMDNTFTLLRSPLLQGLALSSLITFFGTLIETKAPGRGEFAALLKELRASAGSAGSAASSKDESSEGSGARVTLGNAAKAIAAVTAAAGESEQKATVADFQDTVTKSVGDAGKARDVQLGLLALGEIGRRVDASAFSNLFETALKALADAPSEETKQTASFALGSLAVGNVAEYLPKLLAEVQGQKDDAKYLLLHALREVIVGAEESHAAVLREREGEILPLLFSHCEIEDEGTRNVVAECLGKLALGSPSGVLEKLVAISGEATGDKWRTRATAVTAVKFMVVDQHKFASAAATTGVDAAAHGIDAVAVDTALQQHVGVFADMVKDEQLDVRRAALLLLNFAAHHSPHLLRSRLDGLLPLIYGETNIRPELIREVDLGPFKHKVDDGLDLRKAAFETMYTLLETCPDAVSGSSEAVGPFVAGLVSGLKDAHDIRILTHLVLVRLTRVAGAVILADGPGAVDSLIDPIRDTVAEKAKDGAVKQDVDRLEERVRTALRAVAALDALTGIRDVSSKFDEFVRFILGGDLADKFDSVKRDDFTSSGGGLHGMGSSGMDM